ncbi:MAG: hypothetical protein DWQ06_08210 [Calditrichaeota bacterium]|nr:MAG: hypothetical protein DWQ06_08210 [Calditrichota bacterium]
MKLFKIKIFLLLLCSFPIPKGIFAQTSLAGTNLVTGEYFWDNDPNFGNGTTFTFTQDDSIDFSEIVSTTGLTKGVHKLYFRFKDSANLWTQKQHVLVNVNEASNQPEFAGANLVTGEYFWGNDPNFGNGNPFTFTQGDSINFSEIVSTAGLTKGVHKLYFRFKDSANLWTSKQHVLVNVNEASNQPEFAGANLVTGEYFWGNDPNFGNGNPFTFTQGDSINFSEIVSTAGLTKGVHKLYFRFKDSANLWTDKQHVLVNVNEVSNQPEFAGTNLVTGEYFWDNDPSFGNGNPFTFTQGDSIDFSEIVSTSGLTKGVHKLYFRFKDSANLWTQKQHVLVNVNEVSNLPEFAGTNLVSGEYFWDDDPSFGNGTAFTFTQGDSINFSEIVSTTGLTKGVHKLYFRFKDSANLWTSKQHVLVNVNEASNQPEFAGANLVTGEYFWDNDPSFGNGNPFTFTQGDSIDFSEIVSTTGLTKGVHKLYFRFKDSANLWTTKQHVLVNVNEVSNLPEFAGTNLISGEYFWDDDPSFGNGNPFTFTQGDSIDFSEIVSTTGLTKGVHKLYFRFKDSANLWTTKQHVLVNVNEVSNLPEFAGTNLISGEYFWDDDPSFGNGTAFTFTQGDSIDFSEIVSTTGLTKGVHKLYFRFKDSANLWTGKQFVLVSVQDGSLGDLPFFITDVEYFWDNNDPGEGNANLIGNSENFSAVLSTTGLTVDLHTINVRAKNNLNIWSDPKSFLIGVGSMALFIDVVNDDVQLSWLEDPSALAYEIYRSTSPTNLQDLTQLSPYTTVTLTNFTDLNAASSGMTNYFYKIKAIP